jgi:outer membrane protein assembly factor BamB
MKSTNEYLGVAYKNEISLSPLIDDGRCYAHIGGKSNSAFFAFDLGSGELIWKTACEDPADGSPLIMTINGKKQIVTLASKNLMGLAVETGKILWKVPFVADMGNHTSPIIDGNTIYYIGAGKGMFALKVEEKDGKYEPTPTFWSNAQLGARFSTPVLKDGRIYGYTSGLFCANAKTGEKVWADTTGRGQNASILDAGSVLIALGVNRELVVYKPGDEYSVVAKYKVASKDTWAHPLVTSKGFYIRDTDTVTFWSLE